MNRRTNRTGSTRVMRRFNWGGRSRGGLRFARRFTTFRVKGSITFSFNLVSPPSSRISLTHSRRGFFGRHPRTVSEKQKNVQVQIKIKSSRTRRGAACNGGRATSHSLLSPNTLTHSVGVYDRLLEHWHPSMIYDPGFAFFAYRCEVLCLNRRR